MQNLNNIQLIIPCAGRGQRFIDAGYTTPKFLIELDGKPIIKHVVDMVPGVEDITFVCNQEHIDKNGIRKALLDIAPKAKILVIPNHKKGPVYTVSQIFDKIDNNKEIIISYCDCASFFDFDRFLKEKEEFDGLVLAHIGFHPIMLGNDNYAVCHQKDKNLTRIGEKEPMEDRFSEYVSAGTYYFKSGSIVKKYFQELIDKDINIKGEYYVSLVYNLMVEDGLKTKVFEVEKMTNWGTPNDLEEYRGWSDYFWNFNRQTNYYHDKDTSLIIPMAGRGSRFSEEGYELPKPLIEIDGIPMFVRAINMAPRGINKIFVVLEEHIRKYEIDKIIYRWFPYSDILPIKEVTNGQAETCELAIKHFNLNPENPILILPCDQGASYNSSEYAQLVKNNESEYFICSENEKNIDIIAWSFQNNQFSRINPEMYSWLEVDSQNFLVNEWSKYCPFHNPSKSHAIVGIVFFRKAKYFIEALKKNRDDDIKTNGEFYVDDSLNRNVEAGLNVKVFKCDQFICWGTPNALKTYHYWKDYFFKKFGIKDF